VEAAAGLLAELPDAPAELTARVERERAEQRRRAARMDHVERQMDPTIGHRSRMYVGAALGLAWTALPLAADGYRRATGGAPTFPGALLWCSLFGGIALALVVAGRRTLFETTLNRALVVALLFTPVAQAVLQIGAHLVGVQPDVAVTLNIFLWMCVTALLTLLSHRRLWPIPVAFLLSFLLSAAMPGQRFRLIAASNLVLAVTVLYVWRPQAPVAPGAAMGSSPARWHSNDRSG
jgi:hypothetical protein